MSPSTSKIPESLRKALQAGNVIPFVGAGISRSIHELNEKTSIYSPFLFPSWKEFLSSSVNKLEAEKLQPKADVIKALLKDSPIDYLDVAQRAYDSLGVRLWNELLTENFANKETSANFATLELPKLMWKLGSNLVITTNVDDVLEWNSVNAERIQTLDTQTNEFAEVIRNNPNSPTLFYLHGSLHDKANIVFTQKQYTEFYDNGSNKAKLETLRNLLGSRTFLFLGFSLDDPYFVHQLQYIHDIYQGAASSFYVLLHKNEKEKFSLSELVTPIYFEDFDEPLRLMIAEMSEIANVKESGIIAEDEKPIVEETKNTAFFNVEYQSKGDSFVGRIGKKEAIFVALQNQGRASIGQVSVEGFGGLGKTQLAVEFAHEYRNRYPNGVFWLIADANIDNQLLKIATDNRWIFAQDKEINQLDEAKRRFKKLKECLIIFDNVEALETIKDYFPRTDSKTHILLTSRESMQGVHSIDLETLSPEESRELLLKTAERTSETVEDKEYLDKILKELDGLPLAIELVGGYLCEHQNISFKEYNEFLNEYPLSELEQEFPQGSFTDHDRSIVRTLRISEKLFTDKPLLVECLHILAWSGSSSMGISLLQALAATENTFKLKTQLGDGHKLKLLKYDKEKDRYEIHRLLGKVIRHDFTLEAQQTWHKEIVGKLEKWFDKRKEEYNYLVEFESEVGHLQQWQQQTIRLLPKQAVWLFGLEAYPLWQRGNYSNSLICLQKALKSYEAENLNNPRLFADIQNDLGIIYDELGNHQKALEYKEKALEIRIELFGEKHSDTAISYNNVGTTYGDLGNHQKALEFQEKALEIIRELFGEKHPYTATFYNNAGTTYGQLRNHQKALEFQEKALEIIKELFGEKHPYTATFYNNVGGTYGDLKNHQKALNYKEKALEITRELFGEKHPSTANFYNSVGLTYRYLGNKEKTVEYFEKAVTTSCELLGNKHPYTILRCRSLILAYADSGKLRDAGMLAGEFLKYVPPNHKNRRVFVKYGKNYEKLFSPKKKRRR
jgi:tetratricopeptide (TPR) repeat protein